jgi:hypothetical protein
MQVMTQCFFLLSLPVNQEQKSSGILRNCFIICQILLMTIIAVVLAVIAGYAICTLIIIGMKNVDTKSAKSRYTLLSELGSEFNLSFSSHLVLHNRLIALDGIKRILLVSEANNEVQQPCIIELNKVAAVSIKKTYGSIKSGELRIKRFEEFLRRIDLQFEYRDKNESVVLPFYDNETDAFRDLPRLEKNAKNWQMILSKLLVSHSDKISEDRKKLLLS